MVQLTFFGFSKLAPPAAPIRNFENPLRAPYSGPCPAPPYQKIGAKKFSPSAISQQRQRILENPTLSEVGSPSPTMY